MVSDNIVLEHLRAIRATLDNHTEELREIKVRVGILEAQIGTLTTQYASLSSRIDRLDERLARIEKRLDLQDA